MRWFRRGNGIKSISEIILPGNVAVIPVPLGALMFVPLPLALRISTGLLAAAKSGGWNKPFLANPAGPLTVLMFLSHRSLLR